MNILDTLKGAANAMRAAVTTKVGREGEPTHRGGEIEIIEDFLTLNRYSRPGTRRKETKAVEIHWVGNPNTSAKFNKKYFENRRGGKSGYGSAHYIIDLDGDIIQAIPENEVAYSSGSTGGYEPGIVEYLGKVPYKKTVSIECCHTDLNGRMTKNTTDSLVNLTRYLLKKYDLVPGDKTILRHYDITWKICHRWYVDNPDDWEKFKREVAK